MATICYSNILEKIYFYTVIKRFIDCSIPVFFRISVVTLIFFINISHIHASEEKDFNINVNKEIVTSQIVEQDNYTIIPYIGLHYTKYDDKGFEGIEKIELWKSRENILFGVDIFRKTRIVDFGFGFDVGTQSVNDTASIIDKFLGQGKGSSVNTFPIVSFTAVVKKDFTIKNNTFYTQARAGVILSYNLVQNLDQTIREGQIINIDGLNWEGIPPLIPPINIPPILLPNKDITANLQNSLKIKEGYLLGFSFGYILKNSIDIGIYYNIKYFNTDANASLIVPLHENINMVIKDGLNGSAIANEIGIKLGYRI